jgi:methylated-DNA-[protein]-cysteine S-methyltransferase
LHEYFSGRRRHFDIPLRLQGTPFQMKVWNALMEIPLGSTVSYGELAGRIKRKDAVRAVGAAVGRNPVSVIVPCHRVIGSGGSLTGYAGGLERKRALLDLEEAIMAGISSEAPAHPTVR